MSLYWNALNEYVLLFFKDDLLKSTKTIYVIVEGKSTLENIGDTK